MAARGALARRRRLTLPLRQMAPAAKGQATERCERTAAARQHGIGVPALDGRRRLADREQARHTSLDDRIVRPAGIMPAAVEGVQLTEAMVEMVRAGLGVAILARWAIGRYVADGGLAAVRVTPQGLYKEWRAVLPKHLASTDYVTEFLRLIVEHAPGGNRSSVVPFQRGRSTRGAAS